MSAADPTPLIGLTTYRQRASWGAWDRDAALCPGVYLDVVQRAGGQPVLIPPSSASAAAAAGAGARADRGVPTGGAEHLVRALDAAAHFAEMLGLFVPQLIEFRAQLAQQFLQLLFQ